MCHRFITKKRLLYEKPFQTLSITPKILPTIMAKISIVSSTALEPWDWDSPWSYGIGGSETSHIEMAWRLAKRGYNVDSFAPTPFKTGRKTHSGVRWSHYNRYIAGTLRSPSLAERHIVINYRNPDLFDAVKHPNERRWFVSQDVDYPGAWTGKRLQTVDRYICLCKEHAKYVLERYAPFIDPNKLYISSNGVRSEFIKTFDNDEHKPKRIPYRMLYPSSPDRGLQFVLENWFKIRERFPQAELYVAYGQNNLKKVIEMSKGTDTERIKIKNELDTLMQQEGVFDLGRIGQLELYDQWFKASVFPYPSDFPETNCITIQDAMACGAIPVTTNHWAQGEHAKRINTPVVDGLPQKSWLVGSHWLNTLYMALEVPVDSPLRETMSQSALRTYDWENTVNQWANWIEEDSK